LLLLLSPPPLLLLVCPGTGQWYEAKRCLPKLSMSAPRGCCGTLPCSTDATEEAADDDGDDDDHASVGEDAAMLKRNSSLRKNWQRPATRPISRVR
jgi:hypothetical protein